MLHSGGFASHKERKIREYVEAHLSDHICIKKLYKIADMSKTHLERLAKKTFGTTMREQIIKERIRMGCSLLKESNLSIVQVALECGFCNQSYFGVWFKKQMGTSPARWRKQWQELGHSPHTAAIGVESVMLQIGM